MSPPRATYRLQLSKNFGFEAVAKIADYLASLDVSHIYASPFLRSRPGSSHGYDIVDYNALNPDLGTQTDFERMTTALRRCGLGLILDYVPNHMGVGSGDNPQWMDVLEWGRASPYAEWFDIDWNPESLYLRDKVLVPFLGEQYGAALQGGHLRLRFDEQRGSLAVWAYDSHKLPVSPLDYAAIIGNAHPALQRIGDEFSALEESFSQMPHRAAELKLRLAREYAKDDEVRHAVDHCLAPYEGQVGDLASWSRLDALIQRQHWRPAYFRVAADDINYRRFFNINDLAGIRMELPDLFEHAHKLVGKWLADGTLDGLRIDHIDGLFDPREYLEAVRRTASRPFYLVVEKILAQHESLREDWPVEGTTGYDFASQVTGLLVKPSAKDALTSTYERFIGNALPFEESVRQSKLRIMDNEMASELHALARDAARVARENPVTSDFTQNILRRALRQIVACFPVYRTYVSERGAEETDRRYIEWALRHAIRHEPELDATVFDFLQRLLTTDLVAAPRSGFSRHAALRVAKKFQQFTGPVMAKGFEDTALFVYNRLLALNEVGSDPSQFGLSVSAFHKANAARSRQWPSTMLGTSTHDTKRGEDVRARLAVLSELPDEWDHQVNTWSRILRARRGDLNAAAPPSRNDEYYFYQLLLGSWPLEPRSGRPLGRPNNANHNDEQCPNDSCLLRAYTKRLQAAMQKAIREGRTNSNWISPNTEYEAPVAAFIQDALDPQRSEAFLSLFRPFQQRIAEFGMQKSLAQMVLKLTSPGVPDIYQASEGWDLTLGDPDSRREVNYATRAEQLVQVRKRLQEDRRNAMREFFANWEDARVKMAVLELLLAERKGHPDLFASSAYEPLNATGPCAEHICAFSRTAGDSKMIVAVKLFPATTPENESWHNTNLAISSNGAPLHEIFTSASITPSESGHPTTQLFADLPIAVLVTEH
jgi:(1->4)-alpha-D-glucan 1-alpha-D-glucosylmutase